MVSLELCCRLSRIYPNCQYARFASRKAQKPHFHIFSMQGYPCMAINWDAIFEISSYDWQSLLYHEGQKLIKLEGRPSIQGRGRPNRFAMPSFNKCHQDFQAVI